ncbi:MAG: hypothetical protein UU98_C0004G0024 [Parcubacteria group bacterium GW2011_GWD2_42_14]|nr:MAG: hypothetical protein UU98_C0004G0024 [Parcubacteria group bacterium GW2011_GWD2_42_14]
MYVTCIYKPDSVPILPTVGGCKIEYPAEVLTKAGPIRKTRGTRNYNNLR